MFVLKAHNPTITGWNQAIGILHVDNLGRSRIDIIPIKDGKAIINGKMLSI